MTLIKTGLLNAIAVIVKMLTLLGINKILAIYVGPAGYAALGQFQNAVQMIITFASGAINTGVTKYTAEYYDDEEQQRLVWRTAGTIALVGSLLAATAIAIFNNYLAGWFLKDESYGSVFLWFSATLIFFVFNSLLLAILNGKKQIKRYIVANITGSIFAFLATVIMTVTLGLYGALVALAVYQSLSFFITFLLCYRAPWFKVRYLIGGVDKSVAVDLSKYSFMALTSALCVPVSHILIRNYVGENIGWDAAGQWEAMWRLSTAYLMFATAVLSVYYLPRLSELNSARDIRNEILQGYKIILPIALASSVVMYALRDFIILVLFTPDFYAMRDFFAWQMIGNCLKVGSLVLSYLMLGKAQTKVFILTEITFSVAFVVLSVWFSSRYGTKGVSMAYAVNYAAYWGVIFLWLKHKKIFN